MDELAQRWPDPDRRDDALLRCLLDVHSYEKRELVTRRQCQVLEALSHGLDRQGAAEVLGIELEGVKGLLRSATRTLRAKSTTHACCEALRRGLIR